jgi:hypothetical protein
LQTIDQPSNDIHYAYGVGVFARRKGLLGNQWLTLSVLSVNREIREEGHLPYSILDLILIMAGGGSHSRQWQMSYGKWNVVNAIPSRFRDLPTVAEVTPLSRTRIC